MLVNIFRNAIQGYKDLREITRPITQTVKVGFLVQQGLLSYQKQRKTS